MSNWIYVENNDPADRFTQLQFQRDDGSAGYLRLGRSYTITNAEAARCRAFVVLAIGGAGGEPVLGDGSLVETVGAGAFGTVIFSARIAAVEGSPSVRITRAGIFGQGRLTCQAAPAGSSLTVQLKLNGGTVTTFTIASGSTAPDDQALNLPVVPGDELAVNCTSIGSTTPARQVALQVDPRS